MLPVHFNQNQPEVCNFIDLAGAIGVVVEIQHGFDFSRRKFRSQAGHARPVVHLVVAPEDVAPDIIPRRVEPGPIFVYTTAAAVMIPVEGIISIVVLALVRTSGQPPHDANLGVRPPAIEHDILKHRHRITEQATPS